MGNFSQAVENAADMLLSAVVRAADGGCKRLCLPLQTSPYRFQLTLLARCPQAGSGALDTVLIVTLCELSATGFVGRVRH
eukprot:SAG31_NODE_31254_length_370_cov_0.763838_1_plen_80_part_00